jgi:small-conductance mechanosensitive channel
MFHITGLLAQEFTSVEGLISDTIQQTKQVPVTSISSAVEETNQMIRKTNQSMVPSEDILGMDSVLSLFKAKIDSISNLMDEDSIKFSALQDVERKNVDLNQYKTVLTEYNQQLQTEIEKLNNEIEKIQKLDQIWENTRSVREYNEVSPTIHEEINSLVIRVKDVKKALQVQINKYLEMQIEINRQLSQIQEMLDELNLLKEEVDRNLFSRTAPPLWKFMESGKREGTSKLFMTQLLEIRKRDILSYFHSNKSQVYLALLYLVLFQIFFYYVKSQIKKTEFEKELDVNQNTALRLLDKNWATAMVLGLLIIHISLPNKPPIIITILFFISLFPLYYLFIKEVEKIYHVLIRMLFLIFLLTLFVEPIREVALFRRFFLVGLNLITLVLIITLLRRTWYQIFKSKFVASGSKLISEIFVVFLILSLITNVWGSYRFSIYLTYAISRSLFAGLLIYLLYLVLLGITTAFLFSRSANRLNIVKNFRYEIEHKISTGARLIMILLYVILLLSSFDVLNNVLQFLKDILEHPFNIGNFNFTIGDILLFIIIIMIAQWISNFIVFILDEQIYYKTQKKKDVAASVSALIRFTIITVGFLLGVVAIGFELDKLTLLLSAFGVGIGFGLQNIFNNLVSGIIMVFERPLQVGDVIEVGQLIGTVKSIGIRSSVVRTFDGSEVIVPNGNLISNELINWTHSDMQRRLIIRVGVAYGTDPEKVINILEKVVEKDQNIMVNPKPHALFTEFADSSLNFELRCWTDNFDEWMFTISDVRIRVNQALKEAGITIPFPQRDVHLFNAESVAAGKPVSKKK